MGLGGGLKRYPFFYICIVKNKRSLWNDLIGATILAGAIALYFYNK